MSMIDEIPDFFIENGKIYAHHRGSSYVSGGFIDHEPSYDKELCEATPQNINHFLETHTSFVPYLYNYDTHQKQKYIESNYKDAFGKNIFKGSIVYCMNNWYNDTFAGYIKGEVVGFTNDYVNIKTLKMDEQQRWRPEKKEFKRAPHRVIVIE